ncbi:hypothetical protein BDZ94DRAFT_1173694 [Collybia nuda]|uniref:RING-type domain-containing protein n=1 Tax=Collybia nuda TaxID=64659 RepID=A0A9P6CEX9_9AGAR|nr:hypothetical protein BDZ94DRAFT_1173694 [Collybia nuda]
MPLIIHPESSCDVCLEGLTYDDHRPPYAIPCGHVFCGACLYQIHPRICPLCREPYSLEPTRRLITGERPAENKMSTTNERTANEERPAVNDSAEDDELLRRLIVSWDMQEEQLSALLTQVDTWLQGRPQDTVSRFILLPFPMY